MTALTARRVCMASARAPSARPILWQVIKPWSPAAFLSILSPPSSFLAMSRASGLWRAPLSPRPPLQARGPTERYDEASQKNASTRLLAVTRSRSRQHSLVNYLAVGLPSVRRRMTLIILPDFLARQPAAHAISLRCSPTATRSVPSLLNESSTPPSNVFHDNAASAR